MDPVKPPPLWTSIFGLSCVLIILLSALSLRLYYQRHYSSQIPNQQTPSDDISSWKIYSDELGTYQIDAPVNWEQITHSTDFINYHFITLRASDSSTFQSAATNAKDQTLISYLQDLDHKNATGWEGQPGKKILSSKNVTVDSLSGIERLEQWLAADYITVVTYLKAGDFVYDFSIQPGDIKYSDSEVYKNYSRILSTFRLINNQPLRTVRLYYTDDITNDCEAKSYTESRIPISQTPITDTIKLLISGWNPPPEFYLKSANLKNGTLILEFPMVYSFTTGGSCHIQSLTTAIINTAKQFPEVKQVIFDPEVFEP